MKVLRAHCSISRDTLLLSRNRQESIVYTNPDFLPPLVHPLPVFPYRPASAISRFSLCLPLPLPDYLLTCFFPCFPLPLPASPYSLPLPILALINQLAGVVVALWPTSAFHPQIKLPHEMQRHISVLSRRGNLFCSAAR